MILFFNDEVYIIIIYNKHMVNTGSYRKTYQTCFNKKCCKKAEYRAPKSRSNLNDYHWFCLEHIREYNKSWNYYEGMSENEIEFEIRSSTTWERPTWPINGNSNINFDNLNLDFDASIIENKTLNLSNTINFKQNELQAFKKLEINPTIDINLIKSSYKKLVKKFHPDNNNGKKVFEEKLKSIIEAYTLLKNMLNNSI
mgnify:FL=1